jgi:hypothetical protein
MREPATAADMSGELGAGNFTLRLLAGAEGFEPSIS